MCYNQEKYIADAFYSALNQTYSPMEIVVSDDCSSDNTVEILAAWAESVPFSVKVVQNEKNLGYAQNFAKAISLCSSDVIFFLTRTISGRRTSWKR